MRVLLSAGEPSGRLFAALIERELAVIAPDTIVLRPEYVTGAAGSVLGFAQGVRAAPKLGKLVKRAVRDIAASRPDVVVLIGYPGFHLSLGRRCRELGLPVVCLGPPQVWAWGGFRTHALRRAADKVVCLFPFEEARLRSARIDVGFTGYPLFDALGSSCPRSDVIGRLGWEQDARYVVFLPGSRPAEIAYHRPLFERVATVLEARSPDLRGVVLGPPADCGSGDPLPALQARYGMIQHAECAVVVSGTATLETALLGIPQLVCYHLSPASRLAARVLVKLRYFSLPNILLREGAVPEMLEPTAGRVEEEVLRMLGDPRSREAARDCGRRLRGMLGPPGVMERIARLVLDTARAG